MCPLALSADLDLSDERSTPNTMCNDRLAGESGTRARFFESFVRDESRAAGRMVRGIGGGVSRGGRDDQGLGRVHAWQAQDRR